MALDNFAESWAWFLAELASRGHRMAAELGAAWEDLDAALGRTAGLLEQHLAEATETVALPALQRLIDRAAGTFLIEPLSALGRKRPLQRVLSALEDHDSAIGDIVRQLPGELRASASDLAALRALGIRTGIGLAWARMRRATVALPLRELVRTRLLASALMRSRLEGELVVTVARGTLHILAPWQVLRRAELSRLVSAGSDSAGAAAARAWLAEECERLRRRGRQRLEQLREAISADVEQAAGLPRSPRAEVVLERRRKNIAHWSRLQRAVQSLVELEINAAHLARDAFEQTSRSFASLESEYGQLLKELDGVMEWLERRRLDPGAGGFPPPQAQLVSAEKRSEEWVRAVAAAARSRLPAAGDSLDRPRPLPGWRNPWRRIEPLRHFLNGLEGVGRAWMLKGLKEAEEAHRSVVREIERAREVVAFGMESGGGNGAAGAQLAAEAVDNAIALLAFQKRTVPDARPAAERHATRAQAAAFLQYHRALEESRLGLLAHFAQRTGTKATARLWAFAQAAARTTVREAERGIRRAYGSLLVRVGLAAPPAPRREPVQQWPRLSGILAVNLGARDLPMIYRRLFRLAPVEDPRFLIGREAEMAGLADAFSTWSAGGTTASLIVGARGSGKTSLLNCAESAVFARAPIVRGQFERRLTGAGEMRAFLAALFRLPSGSTLEESLEGRGLVVILEEAEKTFLRRINGLAAVRELLDIMVATAHSVFWVISLNEMAFRFLHATVQIAKSFSHQINATSVSPEAVKAAILQRHHLSGLRLEFAPPPAGDPGIRGLRRFAGLEMNPEQVFFDALCRQSEGIFRSAFELWQDSIERVEGGVVYMHQPLDPDYRPLWRELDVEDLFCLQAVMQHGCLSSEEFSEVLRISEKKAAGLVRRLSGLEILEPEPDAAALRVRPQAVRFVREVLHGHNLL